MEARKSVRYALSALSGMSSPPSFLTDLFLFHPLMHFLIGFEGRDSKEPESVSHERILSNSSAHVQKIRELVSRSSGNKSSAKLMKAIRRRYSDIEADVVAGSASNGIRSHDIPPPPHQENTADPGLRDGNFQHHRFVHPQTSASQYVGRIFL